MIKCRGLRSTGRCECTTYSKWRRVGMYDHCECGHTENIHLEDDDGKRKAKRK